MSTILSEVGKPASSEGNDTLLELVSGIKKVTIPFGIKQV